MPCRAVLCLHCRNTGSFRDIPVPERDDELGQPPYTDGVTIASGESKIRHLDLTTVIHQEVGRLEVSVQDPVFVTMGNGGEQLKQQRFDLRL